MTKNQIEKQIRSLIVEVLENGISNWMSLILVIESNVKLSFQQAKRFTSRELANLINEKKVLVIPDEDFNIFYGLVE